MTNQGWLFKGQGQVLELTDVPTPTPGDGQVTIDVASAGLCHSDIGIIEGPGAAWAQLLPLVLGHEVAGTVREIGPGVTGWQVGDRVAIGLLAHGPEAKTGWDAPGLSRNGGYEKVAIAEEAELVRVPDEVSLAQAAAATDSVVTAYHAVVSTAGVKQGSVVGIVGLGGLGMNALQTAIVAGAEVHGVDISEGARSRAKSLGAASVHANATDLAQFNPDVILDFAGFGTTTADAVEAVRIGGLVVVVGLGRLEATINTNKLVTGGVTLRGSAGGSKDDLKTVLQLIADGKITNVIEEIPFEDLTIGLDRLSRGELVGRLVLSVSK